MPQYTTNDIPRFWSKVDTSGDCWIWTATKNRRGYGQFYYEGRLQLAHRVAYKLTYGPVDDDIHVLHRCDNPSCIRPDHLFLGTQRDNVQDMIGKGRAYFQLHPEYASSRGDDHYARQRPELLARGERHGMHVHPESRLYGEKAPAVKLTLEQVRAIRRAYSQGNVTKLGLARQYNISRRAIQKIISGENWAFDLTPSSDKP